MLHAAVRRRLLASSRWEVALHGVPISALQTAAGPAFFGTCTVRAMRRLGARVSADEAASFCLIWRYVSHLLGVPAPLLGASQIDQDAFDHQLLLQTFQPDDRGRQMLQILLDGLTESPCTRRLSTGEMIVASARA